MVVRLTLRSLSEPSSLGVSTSTSPGPTPWLEFRPPALVRNPMLRDQLHHWLPAKTAVTVSVPTRNCVRILSGLACHSPQRSPVVPAAPTVSPRFLAPPK